MKHFMLWCAAALITLLASCNFSVIPPTDFTETRTFDLASPEPLGDLPFTVDVDAFSSECSGRYKMVFREDANRIEVDEYSRWSMPPGAMLTKYLAARFAARGGNHERNGKPTFELDGSVLNCEMDKAGKRTDLMVHFFIIEHGNDAFRITGTESYSIPAEKTTPEAFADGMNKAAAKFADHVATLLKEELVVRAEDSKNAPEK
jgi:hypothetical protein